MKSTAKQLRDLNSKFETMNPVCVPYFTSFIKYLVDFI